MFQNDLVRVYMGSTKIIDRLDDKHFIIQTVKKAYLHADYFYEKKNDSEYVTNDIAVALLKKPYLLNQYVKTIKLPDESTKLCESGIAVGGGYAGFADEDSKFAKYAFANTLNVHQISLKPALENRTVFFTELKWHEGHPLKGDSGGPFVCGSEVGPIQYGIVSNIYNNSERGTLITEYESVDKYLGFIKSIVKPINKIVYRRKRNKCWRAGHLERPEIWISFLKRANALMPSSDPFRTVMLSLLSTLKLNRDFL